MNIRRRWWVLLAVGLQVWTLCRPHVGQAQERPPQFLFSSPAGLIPLDIERTPALMRRFSPALQGMPLAQALHAIAAQSGVQFAFSGQDLPPGKHVRLVADEITVAAALTEVLLGTGLDVVFSRDGSIVLVRRTTTTLAIVPVRAGTIRGRVIEAVTAASIVAAQVTIGGTGLTRYTDAKGEYVIGGVPTGPRTISVRRLGFAPVLRAVEVRNGETAIADIVLARMATTLTEVVTTATGERSRLEVGNAIGTIKADSLVSTTLIRNMADLLQARTPGVIVSNTSGLVGAPSKIRIRGINSMQLNNDPIIILDGMRLISQTSAAALQTSVGSVSAVVPAGYAVSDNRSAKLAPSRLDDIDPNTIESIDVLRGPSAAALYGTEAAAGVIVIKTKKGQQGDWRTTLLADQGVSYMPGKFPDWWFGWGTAASTGATTSLCMLARPGFGSSTSGPFSVDEGTCTRDSVTHFHPENDPLTSTIGTGTNRNVSGNLSGGGDRLQEFLAFRVSDNVGMPKMAAISQHLIDRLWSAPAPSWMVRPNTEQAINGSARTTLRLGAKADASLNVNGSYRNVLNGGAAIPDVVGAVSYNDALGPWDTLRYLPSESQRAKETSLSKRGYATATANYGPWSWLVLRGTVGGDYTLRTDESVLRASDCTPVLAQILLAQQGPTSTSAACRGGRVNRRGETFITTVDLSGQISLPLSSWLASRTAFGVQYNKTRFYSLSADNTSATSLAFGTTLLTPAPVAVTGTPQLYDVTESRDQGATAGRYVEQTFAARERLFLTAAFRQDAASAFGVNVRNAPPIYPKVSLSWVASDEAFFPRNALLSTFRLRTAYGHSGSQASQQSVLNNYLLSQAIVEGVTVPAIAVTRIGNPDLRPERTAEWEGGLDAGFLTSERVRVEWTMYRKRSVDALTSRTLPSSYGIVSFNTTTGLVSNSLSTEYINLGAVENRGMETSVYARVIDGAACAWELAVNWTENANTLVRMDPLLANTLVGGFDARIREGYPLYGHWGYPIITYADVNGDGILGVHEITFGNRAFMGAPYPRREVTYVNTVSLFRNAVRVTVNLDQIQGLSNVVAAPGARGAPRASFDPTTSLAQQAAAMQAILQGGFYNEVSSLRLSELSVTYTAPRDLARRFLRASSFAITAAGRNLALWTTYAGKDPNIDTSETLGDATADNGGGLPQPRMWTVRLNLGL